MHNVYNAITEIEDIAYHIGFAICNLNAVHEAIVNGSFAPDEYADALVANYFYMQNLHERLSRNIEAAYNAVRAVKEAAHE